MKKALAMFVAIAMGVSMLSGSVFATEASTEAGTEAEAAVQPDVCLCSDYDEQSVLDCDDGRNQG